MSTASTLNLVPNPAFAGSPVSSLSVPNQNLESGESDFSCDEDTYVSSLNSENSTATQAPWYKRLLQGVINKARNGWRVIRRYNPITLAFNYIENRRVSSHVRNAEARGGATTDNEIRQYHQSLLFNPQEPNENALFRYHFHNDNSPRPLVVLCLGNAQTHLTPANDAGINELYNRFKNAGYNVIAFRASCASTSLKNRFFLSNDFSLHPQVIEAHMSNILQDIINGRGLFRGLQQPTQVAFGGYSFGGGCVHNMISNWRAIGRNIPIAASVYIDPIQHGQYNLGCPIENRPNHEGRHCLFYQEGSIGINGVHQNGLRTNDRSYAVPERYHCDIDDDPAVLQRAFSFITNQFNSNSRRE